MQKNGLAEAMAELVYPRHCPVCHEIMPYGTGKACVPCRASLSCIGEPKCRKCGKPVDQEEQEYCFDCSRQSHSYEQGTAVWLYDKKMKESIYRFKYHNKREYGDFYTEEIMRHCGSDIQRWKADMIIPVPLHKSKMRKRGFNQAELIARGIGESTGIPVRNDIVVRNRKTLPQKELSLKERQINLKRAFKILDNDVELKIIILIDDIYTTGSTVDGVAEVLLEAGASRVYYVSICIGKGI